MANDKIVERYYYKVGFPTVSANCKALEIDHLKLVELIDSFVRFDDCYKIIATRAVSANGIADLHWNLTAYGNEDIIPDESLLNQPLNQLKQDLSNDNFMTIRGVVVICNSNNVTFKQYGIKNIHQLFDDHPAYELCADYGYQNNDAVFIHQYLTANKQLHLKPAILNELKTQQIEPTSFTDFLNHHKHQLTRTHIAQWLKKSEPK